MSLEQVTREQERSREKKWRNVDAGLCANCGQPKLSEWYCWDCLTKKEGAYYERAYAVAAEKAGPGIE